GSHAVVLTKGTVTYPTTQGFHGTYHVGASAPTSPFPSIHSFSEIAAFLNAVTLDGPTTFLLDDASYTEAGVAISGANWAGNSVTIQPNTGNTACNVSLSDNTSNKGGLVFLDANHLTING